MGGQTLHIDIAIIGGGIAGLWALNQLRNRGYSAALFEQEALGSYQTIGSQGMIHGGVKYALAGAWSGDAQTISAMPAVWRQCLAGGGKVDLRGCKVLSEDFFLWSGSAVQSRLSALLASKLLRGQVKKVAAADYPATLRSAEFRGQVYRLADLVLDVPSLVATLARRQRDAIFTIDWAQAALRREGTRAVLALADCTVVPEQLLLTAGAGNEALVKALGSTRPAMQRRPLQQVLVRHQYLEPFYGHCMGSNPSPRLTISSHRDHHGRPVWYLGGDLSTDAAREAPEQLVDLARRELAQLLPWLDLGSTEWATLQLDRAEPRQPSLLRPDSAFVGKLDGVDNARAAWPTKLTLCPDLADEFERQLAAEQILPRHRPDLAALATLGQPPVATPYWDTLFP
jgi:glycerol-3-phosphate dehydrogenase